MTRKVECSKEGICVTPTVSLVVPCFEQSEFLPEAIQSVVQQTFQDWECIIVNDGSPDDTNLVASDLIAKNPGRRLRLLEKPNGGLSDARNFGIRNAAGRYILPLDSDDKLHPRMLERAVNLLEAERSSIAIVYTHMQTFGVTHHLHCNGDWSLELLKSGNRNPYCSMYRSEVFDAVGGYDTNLDSYEDWDFWLGAAERGFKARLIPEALVYYRVKEHSMYTDALKRHDRLIARVMLNHPDIFGEIPR